LIPRTAAELADLRAEIERQHHEVADLVGRVSAEAASWRPDETRWSMKGHLAHLVIVNAAYLEAIEEAIRESRADGGPESSGPYRHPWLSRRFVRMLEPPVKRRFKTFRSMVPEPDVDLEETWAAFQRQQGKLETLVDEARGLDLGRVRFGSPFFGLLRFSLGAGLEVVLAHNRRHLWLIRELMDDPAFP